MARTGGGTPLIAAGGHRACDYRHRLVGCQSRQRNGNGASRRQTSLSLYNVRICHESTIKACFQQKIKAAFCSPYFILSI